ncbi:MAG TPA: hypothetical protein VHA56_20625 [Mucilaginibacter sp.]|nr:hypothetical protein [Mucilaginibacter sp.]
MAEVTGELSLGSRYAFGLRGVVEPFAEKIGASHLMATQLGVIAFKIS